MGINGNTKDELIINIDSSSLETIDKFIDLLKEVYYIHSNISEYYYKLFH
ncbi:hypothetical protein H8S10_11455 [Clostridium sp. NSJ-49]|nr:hypothetical protein [Clostridium sp. NSJ-49]MBC5626071.1 hypothetical protein [Clostridium sp. NSJ-49]